MVQRERRYQTSWEKSGQGKMFYEPAQGPQQVRQAEERSRRLAFEDAAKRRTSVEWVDSEGYEDSGAFRDDPDIQREGRKMRSRAMRDEPDTPEEYLPFSEFEDEAVARVGVRTGADIGRTLAKKTTVPESAVEGLRSFRVERTSDPDDDWAHYDARGGPQIRLSPQNYRDPGTLAHEIGHHVSTQTPGHEGRMWPRTDDLRGVNETVSPREEAFADDYAAQHADPGYRGYEVDLNFENPVFREEYQRAVPPKVPPGSGSALRLPESPGSRKLQQGQFTPYQESFALTYPGPRGRGLR